MKQAVPHFAAIIGFFVFSAAAFSGPARFVPPSDRVPQFGLWEAEVHVAAPIAKNPFTDAHLVGEFRSGEQTIHIEGFCDSQDGSVFRIRFSPEQLNADYAYRLNFFDGAATSTHTGRFRCVAGNEFRPVIPDPKHPKHWIRAQSDQHFYHVGLTAYHLLDPSRNDTQVLETIEYAARNGFNKIRFLLAGYPRDVPQRRRPDDPEYGVEQSKSKYARNYGAPDGSVNPLPVWVGEPHRYDFTRFTVAYWQKAERAIRAMRDRGIVATVIFTIEKQNLPKEYGALTEAEFRFYRYGVARLAAFSNVWWDLGNEHNEYREAKWAPAMGEFVRRCDPYDRPLSVHAYAEWLYPNAPWAGFIITQQYGTPVEVNAWALQYYAEPKPYVNEEYGYEGTNNAPRHGMNADWVRRCHWGIAMAGGYGTYGDQVEAASFYTGRPGKGRAPQQLSALRRFFEALPWWEMAPHNDWVSTGSLCYARPGGPYVVYCPDGGKVALKMKDRAAVRARWFNPRSGEWSGEAFPVRLDGPQTLNCPGSGDWVLLLADDKNL